MLTLADAADALGISPATLRVQIRNGKLRARKVGRDWTVTEREVARYRTASQDHRCPVSVHRRGAGLRGTTGRCPAKGVVERAVRAFGEADIVALVCARHAAQADSGVGLYRAG